MFETRFSLDDATPSLVEVGSFPVATIFGQNAITCDTEMKYDVTMTSL